jgi:hypothetical protein
MEKKQNLILKKIRHKPILLEKIFPYTINRPFIFPFLINSDSGLKKGIQNSYKSLKKKNNFSEEMNKVFHQFKIYRIIQEKNLFEYLYNFNKTISFIYENKKKSDGNFFRSYFYHILDDFVFNIQYLPIGKSLDNFIVDYFQSQKKFCLYFYDKIFSNFNYLKEIQNVPNLEIDLIFFMDGHENLEDYNFIQNLNIKNIYLVLSNNSRFSQKRFYRFIENITFLLSKNTTKNIYFYSTFKKHKISKLLDYLIDKKSN